MIRRHLYMLLAVLVFGCATLKPTGTSKLPISTMKAKQIYKAHQKQKAKFSTLQSRLKIELLTDNRSQSHTVTLRMERGKTIWLNAFLNMLRVKITPKRVEMYNKIDRTYFEGDYSIINAFLGLELNFENLENVLLGDAIFKHKANVLKKSWVENSYALRAKVSSSLLELLYLIDASSFKMESQKVSQPLQNRNLKVDYQLFQSIENQLFPKAMTIKVLDNQKETVLKINLKSVSLNQPLRFPFKRPSGYKPIEF